MGFLVGVLFKQEHTKYLPYATLGIILWNFISTSLMEGANCFVGASTYLPLALPQQIDEHFDQLLASAAAISDPFEQSLFALVQLPYLQPFVDVNKRVSRLAANIPLIRANLCPLSFVDLPKEAYTEAILVVYERQEIELMRDLFVWAYARSAQRYQVVRQSIGEPDPFRLRHRETLQSLVRAVIQAAMPARDAHRR